MSDIQFQTDQFVAGRQDKAAQYQMAGAQALGGAIGQAPGDFMKAQAAQQQLAESQAHIALSEAQRQELQQHMQVTSQLMGLGQQKEQVEAMRLQNAHGRMALQKMQDEQSGKLSTQEQVQAAIHMRDPLTDLPIEHGDHQIIQVNPKTQRMEIVDEPPDMAEERKKRLAQRHQTLADPIKRRQDAIIARMRMLNSRMGKVDRLGQPIAPAKQDLDEQNRLASELEALNRAPDTGVVPPQTPEWDAGQQQVQQPQAQQPDKIAWSPHLTPLMSAHPDLEQKINQLAQQNGLTPQQVADKIASDPQSMRGFLKALGHDDAWINSYIKQQMGQ